MKKDTKERKLEESNDEVTSFISESYSDLETSLDEFYNVASDNKENFTGILKDKLEEIEYYLRDVKDDEDGEEDEENLNTMYDIVVSLLRSLNEAVFIDTSVKFKYETKINKARDSLVGIDESEEELKEDAEEEEEDFEEETMTVKGYAEIYDLDSNGLDSILGSDKKPKYLKKVIEELYDYALDLEMRPKLVKTIKHKIQKGPSANDEYMSGPCYRCEFSITGGVEDFRVLTDDLDGSIRDIISDHIIKCFTGLSNNTNSSTEDLGFDFHIYIADY